MSHLKNNQNHEEKFPAWYKQANKKLYTEMQNDIVRCHVCAHNCVILPDKTGICGIRVNKQGKLYLTTYGRGFIHIDPMEKKPLFHFYPGKDILSVGTIGCNFKCLFCQNYDISQIQNYVAADKIVKNLPEYTPEQIVKLARSQNIKFIAYTYNEPTVYFEYTYDTAKLAKKHGIKNVYVSNGYQSEKSRELLAKVLDAINIDLKSFSQEFYTKVIGAKLQPVLDNIKYFYKQGVWVEVTTLIIPGYNDSKKELTQIAEFIKSVSPDIPWHISRFFPSFKMLNVSPTPPETLKMAYEIGKKVGLNYVYMGNVHGLPELQKFENTYCPKCGHLLIKRNGYNVEIVGIKSGKCKYCGFTIAGRWV